MDMKEEFLKQVRYNIHRNGINDLVDWLGTTDFFEAPASTKYHGAYTGGLVVHSLNVFVALNQLAEVYGLGESDGIENPDESIAIVSLFHDICKAGLYKTEMRWRKDANDKWEQYPTWKCDEDFAFGGHGSKSVYLVQNFMRLTPQEASAINCHMGAWDMSPYSHISDVYERNKLAWLLHVADEAATYIMEGEKE